ncbi:MAG: TetR/AcrR family transcriptional regulator [Pseudomonadota bacterium]
MLDLSSERGRVIQAALKLASERPWKDVSIRDIAEAAGMSLAELRKLFGSKTQVLTAYMRVVDDAVLARPPKADPTDAPRDVLFEVIMARLDIMAEHKAALQSIAQDTTFDSTLARAFLNSQRWMLLAAGLDGDGPRGVLRSVGLSTLFGAVFQVWLQDDDPGQAKTMAALDQRLRRGESAMSGIDQVCGMVERVTGLMRGGFRRTSRSRTGTDETTFDEPATNGPAGPGDDLNGSPQPAG